MSHSVQKLCNLCLFLERNQVYLYMP